MSSIETPPVRQSVQPAASPAPAAAPRAARAPAAATPTDGPPAPRAAAATRLIQGRPNPAMQLAPPRDDGPRGCARTPSPADGPRRLVVSHPFDANGDRSGAFEVLNVAPNGQLSRSGRSFTLETAANSGTIDFTPDGQVGLVALDNGRIGVFRLDAEGKPTVVHEGFAGTFHAGKVVVEPRGDRALVLDRNWSHNGGGVYQVTIGCDGTLTDHGRVLAARSPGAIAFAGDRAVVAAANVGELDREADPGTESVHVLEWGQTPRRVGGADAFGHNQVVVGGAALTSDGKTFLVGDTNGFSGNLNAVAAVTLDENGARPAGGVQVDDPAAIATSPFGQVAIVSSPLTDSLIVLDTNAQDGKWRVRGPVPHRGAAPQLPGDLATIDRGNLRGNVYVSENVSVRRLAFRPDGSVVDLGSLQFGQDLKDISGAIGVTK
ncbi:MAG: hypothetical protein ACAI38_09675 [Myxococcota bacterium]